MTRARPGRRTRKRLGRVVVVEDDPVLALAIEAALRDAGASQVILCPSIASTMRALESGSPNALVIDVHLADQ